jgi:N-acetylmuramoyl-L-alanine amidase
MMNFKQPVKTSRFLRENVLSVPSALKLLAMATAVITSTVSLIPAKAATYQEKEIDQNQIIAVAAPYGQNKYNLVIIEQIPEKNQCWSERGSQPVVVEPLWTTFDFTGHCNRATDSNGYSVRLDAQDYGLDYLLSVTQKNGELQLVANSRTDRSQPPIVIGKTYGMSDGFLKFFLNPGWQLTKRTYEDKVLGHVYLSGDSQAIAAAGDTTVPVATASFRDIANDIYKKEIEQAVALGFIAGFKEDGTFRPQASLTREQLVSMVIESLNTVPDLTIQTPAQATTQPYSDVVSSRWSAAKIQWAKENQIVSGYPDGTFRPEQPVTRAELMAVLRRAAEFVQVERGATPSLATTQVSRTFADISGHWGQQMIEQMSAYCQVASPLNETGNNFNPDTPSGRNYAAAATLRMQTCVADPVR